MLDNITENYIDKKQDDETIKNMMSECRITGHLSFDDTEKKDLMPWCLRI